MTHPLLHQSDYRGGGVWWLLLLWGICVQLRVGRVTGSARARGDCAEAAVLAPSDAAFCLPVPSAQLK